MVAEKLSQKGIRSKPRQGQQKDERFIAVVEDITTLVEERVVRTLHWFKKHADRSRLPFQVTGGIIIILSVSVPLLGVLEGVLKDMVLPIVALAIAALTGFNSFYQWQRAWQGRRQTQFTLEYLLKKWELQMIEAKHNPDPKKAIKIAFAATEHLLNRARDATSEETEEYFKSIHLPRSQGGQKA